jgi:hypothetical protein
MSARRRALRVLIFSRWLFDEARELGVRVPAAEAKHQAEELEADLAENFPFPGLPQDPDLRQLLLSRWRSRADRVWLMQIALLAVKVRQALTERARRSVSHRELLRFYATHKRRFFRPDERDLEIIGGSKAVALQAKREIQRGRPFLEVARRLSSDPEAPGGLWHLLRGHDEPEVERPVFAAKPRVLLGPMHYSIYYIFEVLDAIPAHQQPLGRVEGAIRRELAPSPRRLLAAFEARWTARTSCRAGYVVRRCRQYRPSAPPATRRAAATGG